MNAVVHSLYICRERRYFIHSFILMLCANSLLVPSCFSWFHLRTSEIVLILTIAVANFVFCWEMVCAHSLSQFVAGSVLVQLVPPCSRTFQLFPGGSCLFKAVLVCSSCGVHQVLKMLL